MSSVETILEKAVGNKEKIDVWFFLDTSASFAHRTDNWQTQFFEKTASLPKEKFNVRLFCFDTYVQETNLESKWVPPEFSWGGTDFDIMEKEIQKEIQQKDIKYPEAVFVITDGYGTTTINPEKPENWHWFTEDGDRSFSPFDIINRNCNFYPLADFK